MHNPKNKKIHIYGLHGMVQRVFLFFLIVGTSFSVCAQSGVRTDISLNDNWRTVAHDENKKEFDGFELVSFNDKDWKTVNVPHNWDQYEGYRRMRHGNRHGYAWYRKTFKIGAQPLDKRFFLFFEGVGSYATVWLNGKQVGYHAGGRTTFTLDVTNTIRFDQQNLLAVRADHPAQVRDLPWVCGGCSDERGFSEGSQPMGIFRPVHLIVSNEVRVEPFGVFVWNDSTVNEQSAQVYLQTEIKNYSQKIKTVTLVSQLKDKKGVIKTESRTIQTIGAGKTVVIQQVPPAIQRPRLWSLQEPFLYTLVTKIIDGEKIIDQTSTKYGIRWVSWPVGKASRQFLLNGKPVFINGICEYEHLIGNSHAFGEEQIRSRVLQMKAAGFNAFRDAHHPHNLRYQNYWDSLGLLWWTQMGAHVWFDNPAFRENFKNGLKEWVKERRNSPSLVLWGIQNESKLPEDFARECTEIIRQMDPTASRQRLVTTCNGGSGTDWDVPQNWTGTYGGDPLTYASDIRKQVLIGEYGAWRTLDLHSEDDQYRSPVYSEERMSKLMETKIRLGELAKDSAAGHFMWLFTSHDNPGRVQGGEGFRELDRIGPVNYKGLLTPWEQPLDVYYLYRSNYVPSDKEPMVYIVSHGWPNRWTGPGKKNNVVVYSNCDEVELFNDIGAVSLGKKKRNGTGSHFQWDDVDIRFNVLYAVGYVQGKPVARDQIVLHHLPRSPSFDQLYKNARTLTTPQRGYHYLYRVNCGGGDYTDENGNHWTADREKVNDQTWGSVSWAKDFPGMPSFFASQQRTFDPITGTKDWPLFQTFRFGRDKLQYHFPVPDGEYLVELFFTEPWLGSGGGMDCTGWRLFDVAINGKVVLKDLDIWKQAGHDGALKKTVKARITGGQLIISFPRVASGQALISAIAIASVNKNLAAAPPADALIRLDHSMQNIWKVQHWLDIGDVQRQGRQARFSFLPPELLGATWIQQPGINSAATQIFPVFTVTRNADIYFAVDSSFSYPFLKDFIVTGASVRNDEGKSYLVYKKRFGAGQKLDLKQMSVADFIVMAQPAATIEPAYDLKTVTSYKAIDAKWRGPGLTKGQVEGRDRIIFQNASDDNVLEWNFTVGVADMYSLTISYHNPDTANVTGEIRLLSADGTVMKKEMVTFTPTKPGKSNYINSTTGTMINAGQYKLMLTSGEAKGLSINSLDVQ